MKPRSQARKIIGVVSNDESTSEPNSRRHDQRVNCMLAPVAMGGQDVPGDMGNPHPGSNNAGHALAKQQVYGFIRSSPPVQLDENR